jgi:hypothetical protein
VVGEGDDASEVTAAAIGAPSLVEQSSVVHCRPARPDSAHKDANAMLLREKTSSPSQIVTFYDSKSGQHNSKGRPL